MYILIHETQLIHVPHCGDLFVQHLFRLSVSLDILDMNFAKQNGKMEKSKKRVTNTFRGSTTISDEVTNTQSDPRNWLLLSTF